MPQSMTTARDIPILITSTASSSERRITPSWTIAHLKSKLEPVTGLAPSSQILALRLPDRQEETAIEAEDEESVQIGRWPLVAYAEIKVSIVFFFSFFSFFLFFLKKQQQKRMGACAYIMEVNYQKKKQSELTVFSLKKRRMQIEWSFSVIPCICLSIYPLPHPSCISIHLFPALNVTSIAFGKREGAKRDF